jgi:hypothetical protein
MTSVHAQMWRIERSAGYRLFAIGVGQEGCEFVFVFDDGHAIEFNALLLTDWSGIRPPMLLRLNSLQDLWILQGKERGLLSDDQKAVTSVGITPNPFNFSLAGSAPRRRISCGALHGPVHRIACNQSRFKIRNGILRRRIVKACYTGKQQSGRRTQVREKRYGWSPHKRIATSRLRPAL